MGQVNCQVKFPQNPLQSIISSIGSQPSIHIFDTTKTDIFR